MQESYTYYLLSKYVDHTISAEELETLRLLVNLSDDDELSLSLSRLWEKWRFTEEVNERVVRDMFSEIQNRTRKERFVMMFRKLARVAAILLIPLLSMLSGYLYFNPVDRNDSTGNLVVRVDKGEKSGVTLPDGTQVKLNAESRLSYTHDFGRELRQVNLEGEAYFEVTRNENKPFVVHTKYLNIEVLGTSFNVYSYECENVMEMALISGQIKLQTCSDPSRVVYLKPNEKALFNKESGVITVEKTDNRFETAWLRGDLVFRSAKLSDVLTKLERRYGVNIHLKDSSLVDDLFTGYFDSEYIVEVMDLLEKHYDFTYDVRGDDIFIHP
ncbi:FecR domain-containing protein [uncultured Parabacteroides sp.]|uniref:FecR family protein n=1 Tax=uncultured Parabacteroides sp. TaxID=512312 RepID=UPI0026146968|nr:FecR domain-containing protein [uncultured Parabacteroides sp.]